MHKANYLYYRTICSTFRDNAFENKNILKLEMLTEQKKFLEITNSRLYVLKFYERERSDGNH